MSNSTDNTAPWNIDSARNRYNIQRWGAKYFDINDAGHVVAKPLQEAGATVDITDVIEEAKSRGLKFPMLIRFQDILRHRVEAIISDDFQVVTVNREGVIPHTPEEMVGSQSAEHDRTSGGRGRQYRHEQNMMSIWCQNYRSRFWHLIDDTSVSCQ